MKDKGLIFTISTLSIFGLVALVREGFNLFSACMFGIALILIIIKSVK